MSDAMFGGEGQPFDPEKLNADLEALLAGHPERMGIPPAPPPVVEPAPPVAVEPAPVTVAPVVDPASLVQPAPPAPPAPPLIDADEQAELLILARALRDPERAPAIRQAMLGAPPQPAVAAAPPIPEIPAEEPLPADIDPSSFEAQLWHQQQRQLREVREMRAQMETQGQQSAMEQARVAAQNATSTIVRKYGHVLSPPEIEAVCKAAASRGWVDAMIQARGGQGVPGAVEAGMTEALEQVIRSDDGLLAKVLGGPTVGIPQAALPVQPVIPQAPPQPQHTPEAAERMRQLTALSTGASPTGMAPQRAPMQVDHASGGRMTEQTRQQLIHEVMASGLRQEVEG